MDEDLKRLFADLREGNRRATPAFGSLLDAAADRPRRRHTRGPIAFVMIAGAALAVVLYFRIPPTRQIAISAWRSPTEFLLRMPGEEILRTVPSPSASVVSLP